MNTFTGLLGLTVIGGGLMVSSPAKADTAYHAVYHRAITATDAFSILDKYQNNALSPAEYNNGQNTAPFAAVDANGDGFISRTEFYSYNHTANNGSEMNTIMPAAGGDDGR